MWEKSSALSSVVSMKPYVELEKASPNHDCMFLRLVIEFEDNDRLFMISFPAGIDKFSYYSATNSNDNSQRILPEDFESNVTEKDCTKKKTDAALRSVGIHLRSLT
jgi:hypothetical protein